MKGTPYLLGTRCIIFICLAMFATPACSTLSLKPPKIDYNSIQVKSISFSTIVLSISLSVDNKNEKEITVDSVTYLLDLNGKKFNEETIKGPWVFPKNAKTDITLPVTLQTGSLFDGLKIIKSGDNLAHVVGTAVVNGLRIPFKGERKLKIDFNL